MIDWDEYKVIKDEIETTKENVDKEYFINRQFIIISNFFAWLEHNGGYVLINTDIKKLKTKDKYTETYITRWGIKFQVIKDMKYHKCSKLQIKILNNLKGDNDDKNQSNQTKNQ